jgi:shikimate kinase
MNIVLIGMRRAGKSNVSRRLAFKTKRPVLSTDVLIEYDSGRTIAQIVTESSGDWHPFRDMEFEVVKKVARLDGVVVDCGGGVVVDLDEHGNEIFSERKIDLLRQSGPIVWLQGDIARLAAKSRPGHARPTLDATRSAEQIMRHRLPFYERAADYVLDIEGKERPELVEELIELFPDELRVGKL